MSVEQDFQVLKVRVQGRIHTTSETHLLGDCENLNVIIQMARQYWLGVVENTETQEIIFEGRVSVVDIVDPKEYSMEEKTGLNIAQ